VAEVLVVSSVARGHRVFLSKSALAGVASCFLLMGALAGAYGPLLEHLTRRFEISLPVAGSVFSAHFAGALVAVFVQMWAMERVSGRLSIWVALGCLGLGCAGVAVAFSWPAFLAAVFIIGLGFGGLDLGLNQLVAHSEGPRRSAVLNGLNGAYGFGAVAGPILVSRLGQEHLSLLYAAAAALAVVLIPAVAGIKGRLPVAPRNYLPGGGVLVGIFVVAFVFYVGLETGVGGWMTSHLESVGRRSLEAASLTSGFWLAMAVGRVLATLIPDRVSPAVVVIGGSAVASVALLAALNGQAAPIAYIVTGLAIAPVFPTGLVWLAKLRPGDSRATSWMFPATMLGGGVIPAGIGVVIAGVSLAWAPAVLSAVAIITLAAFVLAGLKGNSGDASTIPD
jgi:FHS family glucose/mannose:H+ symporter-like MFS transporter